MPLRWPARLAQRLAERRHAALVIVVAALLLASPALWTEPVADDLLHELILRRDPAFSGLPSSRLDLFRFADGDRARTLQLMNDGIFPWWTDPDVRLSFCRPLSAATHVLDHALWPRQPALMHLHSLAWFAALLATIAQLYRRLSPSPFAPLALLIYAIDDAHAPAVGWIANRNASVSLVFSLLAVLAHDAWRKGQGGWLRWFSAGLLGSGLLAGETALAGVAYLLAYALFLDRGSWRERALSLLGPLLVLAAWRFCCLELGYGVAGSGVYVDPAREPLGFGRLAVSRVPILLLAAFGLPWADLWEVYPLVLPAARTLVWCFAILTLCVLALALRPLLLQKRAVGFWGTGSVLCALLASTTFPHDRLLLGVTVGSAALVAELLGELASSARPDWRRFVAAPLALAHLVLAPGLLLVRSATVDQLTQLMQTAHAELPAKVVAERTLVLVNPPADPFAAYLPLYWQTRGQPRPREFLWLAIGDSALRVTRVDARTLLIRPSSGYLSTASQTMLRSVSRAFHVGDRVHLRAAIFEISAITSDGRPAEVRVRFERSLDDPELLLYRWHRNGYVPLAPLLPGHSITLESADFKQLLFG